ncbi:MAG: hypothetical protein RSD99_33030, partial [Janthinobacterium sp.]
MVHLAVPRHWQAGGAAANPASLTRPTAGTNHFRHSHAFLACLWRNRRHSVLSLTTSAIAVVCSAADFSRRPAELARIFYNVVFGQYLSPENTGQPSTLVAHCHFRPGHGAPLHPVIL